MPTDSEQMTSGKTYKKLKISSQMIRAPQKNKANEKSEKQQSQADYQLLTQNFVNRQDRQSEQPTQPPLTTSKVPLKALQALYLGSQKNGIEGMYMQRQERPSTPEEVKKHCLNCSGMEDFIKGLQGEI